MKYITVENGVRLCVNDCNPKGEKTVVFIHGWPLSKEIFEYQLNILPLYGVRCVTIDLRGYGASDQPWSGYSYNRMAADVHRVLCDMDLRCCTLFGFSMGGAICVRYLARCGSARINKLVLCGAACPSFVQRPGFPYGKTVAEVNALIASCHRDRPDTVANFGKGCFYSNPSAAFLDWIASLSFNAAGWSTIKCAEALRDEDLRGDLAAVVVPTAIFHGVHDQVCPYALAGQMHAGIRNSFVVPFEKSGHALFYDEKEKCNSRLLEFIER